MFFVYTLKLSPNAGAINGFIRIIKGGLVSLQVLNSLQK
jgi:hypothetical protein